MNKYKFKRLMKNLNHLKDNIDSFGFTGEGKKELLESIKEINKLAKDNKFLKEQKWT